MTLQQMYTYTLAKVRRQCNRKTRVLSEITKIISPQEMIKTQLSSHHLGGGGGGHTPPPDACFPWGTLTLLLRTPTGTVPPPPALSAELQCVAAAYLYVAAA